MQDDLDDLLAQAARRPAVPAEIGHFSFQSLFSGSCTVRMNTPDFGLLRSIVGIGEVYSNSIFAYQEPFGHQGFRASLGKGSGSSLRRQIRLSWAT